MAKKSSKKWIRPTIAAAILTGGGWWVKTRIDPMPVGPKTYFRVAKAENLDALLNRLGDARVIRDPFFTKIYAVVRGARRNVAAGTYLFEPGMSGDQIFRSIANPVRQYLRVPEGRWAARVGKLLEKNGVATQAEYLAIVKDPRERFKDLPIPLTSGTLEGFLYPDTYDFPPLMGAQNVIRKQLENFERKVEAANIHPKDWQKTITIASLLQLEAADHKDRQMIAGVIKNRIAQGMRLQIDATVNYGLQKWRSLTYADYKNVDSEYNTYRVDGLPPGPICSPTIDSIIAAENLIKHKYVYYVALPDGTTIYASNYKDHLKNVQRRRHEMKLIAAQKAKEAAKIAESQKVMK